MYPNEVLCQAGNGGYKGGSVIAFKLQGTPPFFCLNHASCRPAQKVLSVLVPVFGQRGPSTEFETTTRPDTRFRPPAVVLGELPMTI